MVLATAHSTQHTAQLSCPATFSEGTFSQDLYWFSTIYHLAEVALSQQKLRDSKILESQNVSMETRLECFAFKNVMS